MKIYILVGVAGSGKSTLASIMSKKEDGRGLVLSSDDYRIGMFGSLKEGNKKGNSSTVFQELNKDLKEEIERDKHEFIYYDATNINRKRRRSLYRNVKAWSKGSVEVEIIYFSLPLKRLYRNNNNRIRLDSVKAVPEDVIFDMYKNMQVPRIGVDCDSFQVVGESMFDYDMLRISLSKGSRFTEALYESSVERMGSELIGIFEPHDCAPYHLESIDEHINMCIDSAMGGVATKAEWADLIHIAQFHDLGKSITKKMVAKNGTTRATYRGHADVSANYYLNYVNFMRRAFSLESQLDVVEAIRNHMNAHSGLREKNIRNNKLNSRVLKLCEDFAVIDNKSRILGEI